MLLLGTDFALGGSGRYGTRRITLRPVPFGGTKRNVIWKPDLLEPQILGDDRLHDLAGAAVDARDAGVGVQAGDRVLEDVAVTAVQLKVSCR